MRLKMRLKGLAPFLTERSGTAFFQKVFERLSSLEHTLENLRIIKTFFDGFNALFCIQNVKKDKLVDL